MVTLFFKWFIEKSNQGVGRTADAAPKEVQLVLTFLHSAFEYLRVRKVLEVTVLKCGETPRKGVPPLYGFQKKAEVQIDEMTTADVCHFVPEGVSRGVRFVQVDRHHDVA